MPVPLPVDWREAKKTKQINGVRWVRDKKKAGF